jgi:hypothetical protein
MKALQSSELQNYSCNDKQYPRRLKSSVTALQKHKNLDKIIHICSLQHDMVSTASSCGMKRDDMMIVKRKTTGRKAVANLQH